MFPQIEIKYFVKKYISIFLLHFFNEKNLNLYRQKFIK